MMYPVIRYFALLLENKSGLYCSEARSQRSGSDKGCRFKEDDGGLIGTPDRGIRPPPYVGKQAQESAFLRNYRKKTAPVLQPIRMQLQEQAEQNTGLEIKRDKG